MWYMIHNYNGVGKLCNLIQKMGWETVNPLLNRYREVFENEVSAINFYVISNNGFKARMIVFTYIWYPILITLTLIPI